ncbi:HNH endonuclease [Streptomyces sp. CC53]|nr:HNH endonuclease [Streptomyces sp. CC53]OII64601.1 HNH endonuclease [Streptomyces sp. CC53]
MLQRDRATEVHHIDGLGPLGPRGFDPDNWQAMSKSHHARETARDTFGHG